MKYIDEEACLRIENYFRDYYKAALYHHYEAAFFVLKNKNQPTIYL